MGRVIKEFEADPEQKVVLRSETDIVCENCPNNEGGVCTTQDKVLRYDREVLKTCGLCDGRVISFREFSGIVRNKIIDTGIRCDICGDCSWDYICREKEDFKKLFKKSMKQYNALLNKYS